MVSGEFSSMTSLHSAIPDATPEPVGWGTYASSPNVHFFLCHFIDMRDEVPGSYFLELISSFTIFQLGNEGYLDCLSQVLSSLLQILTIKGAQIFQPSLLRLPSFTPRGSHLMVNMDFQFQLLWAKCPSTPPGRIPGRNFSRPQCSN